MKLDSSRQIFEKYINVVFHGNPSNGSRVFPYGQTDTQTDTTKLIVASEILRTLRAVDGHRP